MNSVKPVIFHIDVNSAYLSWEAAYRIHHLGGTEDLREQVAAVAGDAAMRHGIILAKSIPAKRYKIQTGETVPEARRKCPGLILVPPNYNLYDRCSRALMEILREYSPCVEQYSVDEAYADMSGTKNLWGLPEEAADRIRRRIRDELGFTVNIGISENKLLAKMASDFEKPDRVHTLWHNEIEEKMWPLPVGSLFFVGKATEIKLQKLGIGTIGELARTDPGILKRHLKKHGELIWAFANGRDISAVQAEAPPNKGYGNSVTMPFDVTDTGTADLVLLGLCETLGVRLRADGVCAQTVGVGIRTYDFQYAEHQMTLGNGTDLTTEIHGCACRLFRELWDGKPVRHLSVHTGRIHADADLRQFDLFDRTDYEKLRCRDRTVDRIRGRYGMDSLVRASFLGSPIDHMSGGISREKRSVDYSRIEVR